MQSTPFALTYASIAGITLFWGLRQGLLATILYHGFLQLLCVAPSAGQWTLSGRALFYSAIIFSVGLLVTWICHRQNVIGARLRMALASYRAQTEALMEAQQGSNSVAWTLNIGRTAAFEWAEGGAEVFGRPFAELAALNSPLNHSLWRKTARSLKQHEWQLRARQRSFTRSIECDGRMERSIGLRAGGRLPLVEAGIWRGVTIDVTDRKNAELALIRSEKLAAIGRLSATIAHEINNPLEAVTNLLLSGSVGPAHPSGDQALSGAGRRGARAAGEHRPAHADICAHDSEWAV